MRKGIPIPMVIAIILTALGCAGLPPALDSERMARMDSALREIEGDIRRIDGVDGAYAVYIPDYGVVVQYSVDREAAISLDAEADERLLANYIYEVAEVLTIQMRVVEIEDLGDEDWVAVQTRMRNKTTLRLMKARDVRELERVAREDGYDAVRRKVEDSLLFYVNGEGILRGGSILRRVGELRERIGGGAEGVYLPGYGLVFCAYGFGGRSVVDALRDLGDFGDLLGEGDAVVLAERRAGHLFVYRLKPSEAVQSAESALWFEI
ncbi:MAG: hypothetical protein ACUVXI_14240 [bacterium]